MRAGVARRPLRSRVASIAVLPVYVITASLFARPLLVHLASAVPSSRTAFDPPLQAFLLGWDWRSLHTGFARLFDLPIFYPETRVLTYMDHMLGEALVGAPAFLATGSIAAGYNLAYLVAAIASAWATYRLVRLFRVSRSGAWLCGFLFAFSPFRVANGDLLNQLQTQFLPLGLFFGVRYLMRSKLRDAVGTACTLAVQVYFGWYYTYFLAVALGLLAAWALMDGHFRPPRRHPARLGLLAAGVAAVTMPIAWPYVVEHFSMPAFHRSLGEAALYSADMFDYLKTGARTASASILPLASGGQSYWPGLVTVTLAAVGGGTMWSATAPRPAAATRRAAGRAPADTNGLRAMVAAIRERVRRLGLAGYFLLLAPAAFILSLGPVLHVGGHRVYIPLPYAGLYFIVPGFSSMRAPARFAVLATLALVVVAGFGYRALHDRLATRRRAAWRILVVTSIAASGFLAWPKPLTLLPLPTDRTMPPVYRWLAARPGSDPVVEFPVAVTDLDETERYALRQFYLLYHGKPRLDGSSGFVSPRYRAFRAAAAGFPSNRALEAVQGMGGRLVVVHLADYPDSAREKLTRAIAAEARLEPLATFGSDRVYALR